MTPSQLLASHREYHHFKKEIFSEAYANWAAFETRKR
jgi:hypothetical protein